MLLLPTIKREKVMRIVFFLALIFSSAGCCTTSNEPVRRFSKEHPREFKTYKYILPIHLATYDMLVGERLAAVQGIVDGMRSNSGHVPGVTNYAHVVMRREGEYRRKTIELHQKWEEMSQYGGAICQFEWSDGKTREIGILVLKSGEIVDRQPWFVEYEIDRTQTNEIEFEFK